MCVVNRWDIIAFVETHWREGNSKVNIPGYDLFEVRRAQEQKKGGGITIWTKAELEVYEWQRERTAEGPESEILWIIVKDDHKEIAVGVVYFSCHSGG